MARRYKVTYKVEPDDGCCWIVTAHYGHPQHDKVCQIRDLRSHLFTTPAGPAVKWVNQVYLRIGKSSFGKWYAKKADKDERTLISSITAFLCSGLLFFAKRTKQNSN